MDRQLRTIVFSRDRGMQLDAFLHSVELHVPRLLDDLAVLYRATEEAFAAGYELLRERWPAVTWVAEESFRDDLLELREAERQLVFHTDDDVYFRDVGPFELLDDEVRFALRLGLNTTYCYPLDTQEELREADISGDRIAWDRQAQAPGNYSYPLALNGHVFRAEEAHDWLNRVEYANPNELEAALQTLGPEVRPRMASFRESTVVSIPANLVNDTYANRHSGLHHVRALNDRFLAGERIDLAAMRFEGIDACHAEIPYVFQRPDAHLQGIRSTT